jgi:flavin reductase (DIM6/NTAB) family NADH-FMN oxidoreductase RutF
MMSMLEPYLGDARAMRDVFAAYPSGIVALSANIDGEDIVIVASSFTVGVSYDPPMCSVAVQNSSTTWPRLSRANRIGISALSVDHSRAVQQLASRNRERRFDGLSLTREKSGAVFLDGAMAWMECEIAHVYAAGDHSIVVFTIRSTKTDETAAPLVLHRSSYHEARAILMPESR